MTMDQRTQPPAERVPLDRDAIVDAAIALIDAHGHQSVSMRALGKHLGYEAMALYRYVDGREDLLEAVVERLMSRLRLPSVGDLGPHGGWQAYVQQFAHAVRGLALQHPRAFPLIATRHPAAPWLRPPLRSLEVVERFLSSLRSFGFTSAQAVEVYRSFTSFLLGYLLLEAAAAGAETAPADVPIAEDETGPGDSNDLHVDLDDFPTLLELRHLLATDHTATEFVTGLESLLDRLEGRLTH